MHCIKQCLLLLLFVSGEVIKHLEQCSSYILSEGPNDTLARTSGIVDQLHSVQTSSPPRKRQSLFESYDQQVKRDIGATPAAQPSVMSAVMLYMECLLMPGMCLWSRPAKLLIHGNCLGKTRGFYYYIHSLRNCSAFQ